MVNRGPSDTTSQSRCGHSRSELVPPRDLNFVSLLEQAHTGALPVYKVVVPTSEILRFDPSFKPELTEVGVQIMSTYLQMAAEGTLRLSPLLAYPRQGKLIVPDNYFTLAMVEALGLETAMCLVLGESDGIALVRKEGPLDLDAVRSQVRAVVQEQ